MHGQCLCLVFIKLSPDINYVTAAMSEQVGVTVPRDAARSSSCLMMVQ